jgi:hypothetical protein
MKIKKLTKFKILTVYCDCSAKLAKYQKGGSGRLIKLQKHRIVKDYFDIFINNLDAKNSDVLCPECKNRFATIQLIGGKYVYKINQGQLGNIK